MKKMIITAVAACAISTGVAIADENDNDAAVVVNKVQTYYPSVMKADTLAIDYGNTLQVYYSHMMRRCSYLDATITYAQLNPKKMPNWKESWTGCVRSRETLTYAKIAYAYLHGGEFARYRAIPADVFLTNKSAFNATGQFVSNFPASQDCVMQLLDVWDEIIGIVNASTYPARVHVSFTNSQKWIYHGTVNIPAVVYVSVSHPCLNYTWVVNNYIATDEDCGCGYVGYDALSIAEIISGSRYYFGMQYYNE